MRLSIISIFLFFWLTVRFVYAIATLLCVFLLLINPGKERVGSFPEKKLSTL